MQALFDMIERVNRLNNGKVFYLSMNQDIVKKLIVQLNTDGQLRFGELSSGVVLPNYSPTSQSVYGKPNSPIRLYDTGEFWESFRIVDVTEQEVTIGATDYYNLLKRYTEDVLGLTSENTQMLIDKLIPLMQKIVLDEILG